MINTIIDYIFNNHFLATVLLILVGWIILKLNGILIILFLAFILTTAILPLVRFLESKKVSRILASAVIYLGLLIAFVLIVVPLIPFVISQIVSLLISFPSLLHNAAELFKIKINQAQLNALIASRVAVLGENAFYVTGRIFSIVITMITILIISFYLLIDYEKIKKRIVLLFPEKYTKKLSVMSDQIEDKMGAWVRGQLVLILIIGLFTFVAYSLMGLKYALPLAIMAGLFEFIPTVGPLLGAVPAIIVALTVSFPTTVTVILVYIAIQIIEGNLLVPKVMQRAVGLHPLVIILGIIIGGEVMGIKGAFLSIPFISLVTVIFKNL